MSQKAKALIKFLMQKMAVKVTKDQISNGYIYSLYQKINVGKFHTYMHKALFMVLHHTTNAAII